jgi:hypothetical protein
VVAAFFGSLYEYLLTYMKGQPADADVSSLTACFSPDLKDPYRPESSTRHHSFTEVAKNAETLLKKMSADPDKAVDIKPREGELRNPSEQFNRLYSYFCEGPTAKLAEHLVSRGQKVMVIAFDECSNLNIKNPRKRSFPDQYMSLVSTWNIIKAADNFSESLPKPFQFWYTYLDTKSSVCPLVPRRGMDVSSRRIVGELDPLPPFTALGFDQMKKGASRLPQDALELDYLKHMGRPVRTDFPVVSLYSSVNQLWATVYTSTILTSADVKLFGNNGMVLSPEHVLAAFSHRVGLELASTASVLSAQSVAKHLRYLRLMIDRNFLVTSAPSEPILSLVAAQGLHSSAVQFQCAIQSLLTQVFVDLTDKGHKGELIARLIVTLARDEAILRAHFPHKFVTGTVIHTVTLAQLLSALLPSIVSEQNSQLLETASKKHLNFSHFKVLKTGIHSFTPGFLRTAWDRGVAFQCCHNQPVVDIILVTYSGDLSQPWDNSCFGTFAIQVKNRSQPAELALVDRLIGPTIAGRRPEDEVVMLMDLGTSLQFRSTGPSVGITHKPVTKPGRTEKGSLWQGYLAAEQECARWCINIRGIDAYPLLNFCATEVRNALKGLQVTTEAEDERMHGCLKVGLDETKEADMCD